MHRIDLAGQVILVVEDDSLQARDIAKALMAAGATVTSVGSVSRARALLEQTAITCAVIDYTLLDGEADSLCEYLGQRGIPYLMNTGHLRITGPCSAAPVLTKPADPQQVIATLHDLLIP